MAENILKHKPEKTSSKKGGKKILPSLLKGNFLSFDKLPELFPFLMYITVIAIFLIANTYYAEKKVREIEKLRHQVTELRTMYITNKSELMYLSNQSDVARRLAYQGFVESTVPPRVVDENSRRGSFFYKILKMGNN
jgi:hypothetical protein